MIYLFGLILAFAIVVLLKRALRWLWRVLDARAAKRGKLPPFWKARRWIVSPLWGYRRGQVLASCIAACLCLWTVLATVSPLSAPPLVVRSGVSLAISKLSTFYGAPHDWLAAAKSSSIEETTERYTVYPFPRLHLTYASSGALPQQDLGGVIICERQVDGVEHRCRLNLATTLRSPLGLLDGEISGRSPARIAAAFSSDGNSVEAHWQQSPIYSTLTGKGVAEFDGDTPGLPASGPAPVSREWLIAAARGSSAPEIVTDWPFNDPRATNRYGFTLPSEQLLFAAFLSVSKLADPRILLTHDLSTLQQNVLRDYVTIFGHLDQSPDISALLAAPLPDSNDPLEITQALGRQPQVSHLYHRRDVHAKGVYEKLLADLRASGILP